MQQLINQNKRIDDIIMFEEEKSDPNGDNCPYCKKLMTNQDEKNGLVNMFI